MFEFLKLRDYIKSEIEFYREERLKSVTDPNTIYAISYRYDYELDKLPYLASLENEYDNRQKHINFFSYIDENYTGHENYALKLSYASLVKLVKNFTEYSFDEKFVLVTAGSFIEASDYATYISVIKERVILDSILEQADKKTMIIAIMDEIDNYMEKNSIKSWSDEHGYERMIDDTDFNNKIELNQLEIKSSLMVEHNYGLNPELESLNRYFAHNRLSEIDKANTELNDMELSQAIVHTAYEKLSKLKLFEKLDFQAQSKHVLFLDKLINNKDFDQNKDLFTISTYIFLASNESFNSLSEENKFFLIKLLSDFDFSEKLIPLFTNTKLIHNLQAIKDENMRETIVANLIYEASSYDLNNPSEIKNALDFIEDKMNLLTTSNMNVVSQEVSEVNTEVNVLADSLNIEQIAYDDAISDILADLNKSNNGIFNKILQAKKLELSSSDLEVYEAMYNKVYKERITSFIDNITSDIAHSLLKDGLIRATNIDVAALLEDYLKFNPNLSKHDFFVITFKRKLAENYKLEIERIAKIAKEEKNEKATEIASGEKPIFIGDLGVFPFVSLSPNIKDAKWIPLEEALNNGVNVAYIFMNEDLSATPVSLVNFKTK